MHLRSVGLASTDAMLQTAGHDANTIKPARAGTQCVPCRRAFPYPSREYVGRKKAKSPTKITW
jgi:hypothetical protein